jgi:hypothetical protein
VTEIERMRGERQARARMAQRRVDDAEQRLRDAIKVRDDLFFEIHGKAADGYLSYQDISDAVGVDEEGNSRLSKGRIIQIIQPRYKEESYAS